MLWSDHGWHLGDLGVWGKHTLHERSLHSPLIVRTPDMPSPGRATDGIVESVDLFPTLLGLCAAEVAGAVDGESFEGLLDDPDSHVDDVAISGWRRGGALGASVRSADHRLTVWVRGSEIVLVELYDHAVDGLESRNVAADADPGLLDELARHLDARFRPDRR